MRDFFVFFLSLRYKDRIIELYFTSYPHTMVNQDSDSDVNTILIVIILLILVGACVWWYTMMPTATPTSTPSSNSPDMTIDVKLPANTDIPSTGS